MKAKEREEARILRKEGESVKVIAKKVGVSPGTVSVWVRDIVLTEAQQSELMLRVPTMNGSATMRTKHRKLREQYQQQGRELAKKREADFVAGCMLYWSEGAKARCMMRFVNTDHDMMRFFIGFLRKYYQLKDEDFSLVIHWYSDNGMGLDEVQGFWLKKLDLPKSCFRKCVVDNISKYSKKKKKNRHPFGTCTMTVDKVSVVQSIYGAIQEIAGFNNEEWIN